MKLKRLILGALSLSLLCGCASGDPRPAPTAAEIPEFDLSAPPAEKKSELDLHSPQWWEEQSAALISLDTESDLYSSKSGDSSDYAWWTCYIMQSLCDAWLYALDEDYLRTYAIICSNMLSTLADGDGDGFLGWGSAAYGGKYEEFAVHTGLCVKGFADFIMLVRTAGLSDSPAPCGGSYGELAARLEAAARDDLIPAFDRDWNAALGIYMNRPGSGNFGGAEGEISLPHNQYLSMALGLYGMASALSDGALAELYLCRADAMCAEFRSFVNFEDGLADWNYNDAHFYRDRSGGSEDWSHGMMDYRAAVECFNNGGSFSLDELRAFARNLQDRMFNGDYSAPAVSASVDGGGDRTNKPYYYNIMLARYAPDVWQICAGAYTGGSDAALLMRLHPDSPAPESFALCAPFSLGSDRAALGWSPSKYASDYCLEISADADFSSLCTVRPYITDTWCSVSGLKPGTKYYWRVTARNQSGATLTADAGSFRTAKAPKAAPELLCFSYMAESVSPGAELRVSVGGQCVFNAPLLVSQEYADVSIDLSAFRSPELQITVSVLHEGAVSEPCSLMLRGMTFRGAAVGGDLRDFLRPVGAPFRNPAEDDGGGGIKIYQRLSQKTGIEKGVRFSAVR